LGSAKRNYERCRCCCTCRQSTSPSQRVNCRWPPEAFGIDEGSLGRSTQSWWWREYDQVGREKTWWSYRRRTPEAFGIDEGPLGCTP
jgi:hypothetical protein